MSFFFRVRILAFGLAILLVGMASANAQSHYKLIKTIDLPGKGGHGDWVTFDPKTDTVWLAQSPDSNVIVIDARKLEIKAVIPDIVDGNGIATDGKFAFVTDATNNKLNVIDETTFKRIASVDTSGKKPDGVAIDTRRGNVYVGNDDSNTTTVFQGKPHFKQIGSIQLQPNPAKDGPDVNLYVPELDRVYQPVDNVVDVINPNTAKVEAVWDFGLKKAAKPMVYDSKAKHLIIGSRDKKILIVDPKGKLLDSIPFEGGKIDEIAIDVKQRRLFLGDKDGSLEVIDLDSNQVVDHLPAEKDTHTLAVDSKTHRIFVYLNKSNKVSVFEPI